MVGGIEPNVVLRQLYSGSKREMKQLAKHLEGVAWVSGVTIEEMTVSKAAGLVNLRVQVCGLRSHIDSFKRGTEEI